MGNCLKSRKKNPDTKNSQKEVEKNESVVHNKEKTTKPKSWETRPKLNKEDYQFVKKENEILFKKPGQINGQQFIIEKCKNCKILLCDYNDTVFVDDCENCQIFIGPCSSSVFVRTSYKLSLIIACQQLRISESKDINTLLFCMTQPTLEKSSNLKFGCFNFAYFNLREQFDKANLNIWNNSWFEIFDFSNKENKNHSFYPKNMNPNQMIDSLKNELLEEIGIYSSTEDLEKNCIIPLTVGNMRKNDDEEALFFINSENYVAMEQIMTQMNNLQETDLIRTKSIKLDKAHLDQLFTAKTEININEVLNSKDDSLFLLFSGKNCQTAKDLMKNTFNPRAYYVWDKKETIKKLSPLIFDTWKHENAILK